MPRREYQPNEYQYYPAPPFKNGYPPLSKITGFTFHTTDAARDVGTQSMENMKALCRSQLPNVADKSSQMENIFQMVPELKVNGNHKARRQLSARARDAIVQYAAERHFSMEGLKVPDRVYYVLMQIADPEIPIAHDGDPDEVRNVRTENEKFMQKMNAATPAERGKEVERVVNEAMRYFHVFENALNGTVKDEELVENFKALAMAQDVFTNACNFLAMAKSPDENKRIEVSHEVMELLKMMEFHSPKADLVLQKVRMIANANYEFMNFDYLYTTSRRELENVHLFVGSEAAEPKAPTLAQFDLFINTSPIAAWIQCCNGINVANKIDTAFAKSQQVPKVRGISSLMEQIDSVDFSTAPGFTNAIGRNEGYVIAYTDDKAVCYHMDRTGRATEAKAEDFLNDMPKQIDEALKILQNANKGLFIGSKEYDNGLSAMTRLSKDLHRKTFPHVPDHTLAPRLEEVIQQCKAYMETKAPEDTDYAAITFSNTREETRYLAMRQALETCELQLKMINLQKEALEIQTQVADRNRITELRTWTPTVTNTKDMALHEFTNYLRMVQVRGEQLHAVDILNTEGSVSPETYLTAMTYELESKLAASILDRYEHTLDPRAANEMLEQYRQVYTPMIAGLGRFVFNHTDMDALVAHCRDPHPFSDTYNRLMEKHNDLLQNSLSRYTEQLQNENAQNANEQELNALARNANAPVQNANVIGEEIEQPVIRQNDPMVMN